MPYVSLMSGDYETKIYQNENNSHNGKAIGACYLWGEPVTMDLKGILDFKWRALSFLIWLGLIEYFTNPYT